MIEKAKENIKLAGFEKNITIVEGDAEEILKEVEGPFDMIFMDAAKGQYKLFYDMVIEYTNKNLNAYAKSTPSIPIFIRIRFIQFMM